jgi:hypothetical protein
MGSTSGVYQCAPTDDILANASAYLALDQKRSRIELLMTGLPERDDARNQAWQELEVVLKQLADLLVRLAARPSVSMTELRAKADVLSRALGPAVADPSVATPGVLKLAHVAALELSTSSWLRVGAQEQGSEELRQSEN